MITLFCLNLLLPQRPQAQVGLKFVKYEIFRAAHTEYCFELEYLIGRTWVEDKFMGSREVEMDKCR